VVTKRPTMHVVHEHVQYFFSHVDVDVNTERLFQDDGQCHSPSVLVMGLQVGHSTFHWCAVIPYFLKYVTHSLSACISPRYSPGRLKASNIVMYGEHVIRPSSNMVLSLTRSTLRCLSTTSFTLSLPPLLPSWSV
jgi:hypothetical protein